MAYAHGMGASRLRLGLGLEAVLAGATDTLEWRPFVEYHLEVVTALGDPALLDQGPLNRDQHWSTVGLRLHVRRWLTVDAGVDILIRPTGFAFGPPAPPYNVVLGAAVPFQR